MNAVPPPLNPTTSRANASAAAGANSAAMRWAALTEAGKVVSLLAGQAAEKPGQQTRNLPAMLRDCPHWRRELAENAIADLAAIMEPGLTALMAVNARGANPRPAANALWREYASAREAILAILPPTGALGPRRSA